MPPINVVYSPDLLAFHRKAVALKQSLRKYTDRFYRRSDRELDVYRDQARLDLRAILDEIANLRIPLERYRRQDVTPSVLARNDPNVFWLEGEPDLCDAVSEIIGAARNLDISNGLDRRNFPPSECSANLSKALQLLEESQPANSPAAGSDGNQEQPPSIADGPTMEGFFYFQGRPHPFATLQWRLLKALWDKGSVSFETIGSKVYEGEDEVEGKLKKLVSDTNAKLLKLNLSCDIVSPMAGHYILQKLPPVTPGVS